MAASLAVLDSRADTIYDGHENAANFGHTDQNATGGPKASVACAPTATVNSFQFLINTYGSAYANLIDTNANQTVQDLEAAAYMNVTVAGGGATANNIINGKTQWIADRGLSSMLKVESLQNANANDTAQFIAQQLAAGQDVELGFLWTGETAGGGHVVTATGIHFNATNDTGTLDFIDPWGGVDISGTLGLDGTQLQLTYNGGAASGPDPERPLADTAGSGNIILVAAESPVPLPSTVMVGLVLLGAVAVKRVAPSVLQTAA
jgi:hypothetical protein